MEYGVVMELTGLQKQRSLYEPELPLCLQGRGIEVEYGEGTSVEDISDAQSVHKSFPFTFGQPLIQFKSSKLNTSKSSALAAFRIGVLFCGRQSPGGHNVISGLYDAIKSHNRQSTLLGFCDGIEGLFTQKVIELSEDIVSSYRNQGGYDMLGRSKDQIRTFDQVKSTIKTCQELKLDGLVFLGGVTSNSDAARIAETLTAAKCPTKVVGVPVTIFGDLKNQFVEANVGFDTVCKVNSQLISNVCLDALSAGKYYHFIRVMGKKASHIALECALQSHANMVVLGEEVAASKLTLLDITKRICDAVQARAEQDKYHGVILLPEGLIESIPEVNALLKEIHGLCNDGVPVDEVLSQLTPWSYALFNFLPTSIQKQLLLPPESDGSAQLSQIETEKLFAYLVEKEMNKRLGSAKHSGKKFNSVCHFFGYQARGSLPSKFDCDYAYALGHVAYHLLAVGANGYMATISNLKYSISDWCCGGTPFTAMMTANGWSPEGNSNVKLICKLTRQSQIDIVDDPLRSVTH
ncbi:Phosphofructokinase domain [Dillenia turbinata]|uniref:Phosphofructokinase domain n=1 Tax=Dillenia turbinata TaxID=194707 RepID=A0AAN8UQK7_9MAGN